MCDWGGGPYGNGAYRLPEVEVPLNPGVGRDFRKRSEARDLAVEERNPGQCHECEHEVTPANNYCPNCGTRLQRAT